MGIVSGGQEVGVSGPGGEGSRPLGIGVKYSRSGSLISYEQVKYLNAEQHALNRYGNAFETYQNAECKGSSSSRSMKTVLFALGSFVIIYMARS